MTTIQLNVYNFELVLVWPNIINALWNIALDRDSAIYRELVEVKYTMK